jgi:hypothetical protein
MDIGWISWCGGGGRMVTKPLSPFVPHGEREFVFGALTPDSSFVATRGYSLSSFQDFDWGRCGKRPYQDLRGGGGVGGGVVEVYFFDEPDGQLVIGEIDVLGGVYARGI